MPRRLSDQVVVVTGASSGIGRAIARAFGAAGAKVGLIARTRAALEEAEPGKCPTRRAPSWSDSAASTPG